MLDLDQMMEATRPPELLRRQGTFRISLSVLEMNPKAFIAGLCGVGVLRAEVLLHIAAIQFTAISEDFALCEPGALAPEYELVITQHAAETGEVTFTREFKAVPPPAPLEPELPPGMVAVPRDVVRLVLEQFDRNLESWGAPQLEAALAMLEDAAPAIPSGVE